MNPNLSFTRYLKFLFVVAGAVMGLSAPLSWHACARGAVQEPSDGSDARKAIHSIADLDGSWTGEKDGVNVDLRFNSKSKPFQASWTVTYTVRRPNPAPQEPSLVEVRKGANLRCVLNAETGRAKMFLPAYLGKDEAIKHSALNGKNPVAEISQQAGGALQLRIIPTGYQDPQSSDYDFPEVNRLVLRRVTRPSR